jgi:AcrR family transcriptional regulator
MAPEQRIATAPATEKGEETRSHILALAGRMIAEHGYGGMSLNDLIRQSGLTKGAFYFHFRSKDDLAREVYRFQQERWTERILSRIGSEQRALDRLTGMARALVEIHGTDPAARAFERMCTEHGDIEGFQDEMRTGLGGWVELVTDTIRQAQDEGDVGGDVDAAAAARVCVAGFIGMEEVSYSLSDGEDLPGRIEEFLTLLLRAIKT